MCVRGEGCKKKSTWDTVKQLKYSSKAVVCRITEGMAPLNWIRSLIDPTGRCQGSPVITPAIWLHTGTSLPRASWLTSQPPGEGTGFP